MIASLRCRCLLLLLVGSWWFAGCNGRDQDPTPAPLAGWTTPEAALHHVRTADPVALARRSLRSGDRRLLAVHSYAPSVPGLSAAQRADDALLQRHGHLVVPGTSDSVSDAVVRDLMRLAPAFAARYNRTILADGQTPFVRVDRDEVSNETEALLADEQVVVVQEGEAKATEADLRAVLAIIDATLPRSRLQRMQTESADEIRGYYGSGPEGRRATSGEVLVVERQQGAWRLVRQGSWLE